MVIVYPASLYPPGHFSGATFSRRHILTTFGGLFMDARPQVFWRSKHGSMNYKQYNQAEDRAESKRSVPLPRSAFIDQAEHHPRGILQPKCPSDPRLSKNPTLSEVLAVDMASRTTYIPLVTEALRYGLYTVGELSCGEILNVYKTSKPSTAAAPSIAAPSSTSATAPAVSAVCGEDFPDSLSEVSARVPSDLPRPDDLYADSSDDGSPRSASGVLLPNVPTPAEVAQTKTITPAFLARLPNAPAPVEVAPTKTTPLGPCSIDSPCLRVRGTPQTRSLFEQEARSCDILVNPIHRNFTEQGGTEEKKKWFGRRSVFLSAGNRTGVKPVSTNFMDGGSVQCYSAGERMQAVDTIQDTESGSVCRIFEAAIALRETSGWKNKRLLHPPDFHDFDDPADPRKWRSLDKAVGTMAGSGPVSGADRAKRYRDGQRALAELRKRSRSREGDVIGT